VKRCTHRYTVTLVDLNPAFGEEFLDVAEREPLPEVPAHGGDDDVGRERPPRHPRVALATRYPARLRRRFSASSVARAAASMRLVPAANP
jgi:hypothetical protein